MKTIQRVNKTKAGSLTSWTNVGPNKQRKIEMTPISRTRNEQGNITTYSNKVPNNVKNTSKTTQILKLENLSSKIQKETNS